jgi:hypothetical protein
MSWQVPTPLQDSVSPSIEKETRLYLSCFFLSLQTSLSAVSEASVYFFWSLYVHTHMYTHTCLHTHLIHTYQAPVHPFLLLDKQFAVDCGIVAPDGGTALGLKTPRARRTFTAAQCPDMGSMFSMLPRAAGLPFFFLF